MHNKTLAQLASMLANRELSSEELTKHYLDRISKHDQQLNAFISVCEQTALQQAREADKLFAKGQVTSPLMGIPVAQKDIFCTKGIKTSCGSKMLDNFISPYDATVMEKFNHAGAVMLGKTNMDEFAMGSSNENSFYGAVRNPWKLEHVPGGSSGGSAAAVAARLCAASTGTDTGGSIRQPSALTGITGLKPTYGRISRYGMVAFASSLDQAGPFAQTAEDAAMMLQVMAGFDPRDSTSIDKDVPDYCANLNDSLQGLRIGLPKEYFAAELDSQMADVVGAAIKTLEGLGATVTEISLPHTEYAIPVYYVVAPAEASSNLSRFDGVRYGYRCEAPENLEDLYKRSRGEGFGDEVKRRIMVGTYALSAGYYDAYYLKAQQIRRLIRDDFIKAYENVDVILAPTSPNTAFKIGEKTADPVSMYLNDIYTISVNLAGLPGLSMPAGFIDGLPCGVQLIGNYFDEARILNVAHQYQQATDWHQCQPDNFKD